MRPVRKRLFVVLLGLAVLPLLWASFRQDGLVHRVRRLGDEVRSIVEQNRDLAEGNRRLAEQASALKSSGPYVEGVIRRDLGMVREGEVVVRLDSAPAATRP